MEIGFEIKKHSSVLGNGIYFTTKDFSGKWRFSAFEGASYWVPGLVISYNVIDIRLPANALIWERGKGFYIRLLMGKHKRPRWMK